MSAEPTPHPLYVALGSGWRWLRDAERDTVVILSAAGAWFEVDVGSLWDRPESWAQPVADAMRASGPGNHTVEVSIAHGVLTCRAHRLAP